MGCDIHSHVEKQKDDGTWLYITGAFPSDKNHKEWYGEYSRNGPFDWRSYGMFGFLADVRNYSFVPFIAQPRGLPEGLSDQVKKEVEYWEGDGHSHSWLTVKELADFDYGKVFGDRRCTREESPGFFNGAADAGEGNGEKKTYRDFLGERFFDDLEVLKSIGEPKRVRVVFWFDN
jgi:hypothetical protein